MDGPSPDLAQVDIVILTDKDGLGERRLVIPVIKRRKTVFNAVGRGEEAEIHLFPADLPDFPDRFLADRKGRQEEFYNIGIIWMAKMTPVFSETKFHHGLFDLPPRDG